MVGEGLAPSRLRCSVPRRRGGACPARESLYPYGHWLIHGRGGARPSRLRCRVPRRRGGACPARESPRRATDFSNTITVVEGQDPKNRTPKPAGCATRSAFSPPARKDGPPKGVFGIKRRPPARNQILSANGQTIERASHRGRPNAGSY